MLMMGFKIATTAIIAILIVLLLFGIAGNERKNGVKILGVLELVYVMALIAIWWG